METYRKTKLLVDPDAVKNNVKTIINSFPEYSYFLGVIKAKCYGLGEENIVQAIIDGGCNYLCVSLVEEALFVREKFSDIPILILDPAPKESFSILQSKSIAVTVTNLDQAEEAGEIAGLKVFIRANGGHDIFGGPTNKKGFEELYEKIVSSLALLEGIYLHNYNPENEEVTNNEYALFEDMTTGIDLSTVPIISTSSSLTMPRYKKKPYANACRIGNIIYGIENDTLDLKNCFVLKSEVAQIIRLCYGESIGYVNSYIAKEQEEFIGVISIGYGDGFAKSNIGRDVFIEDRRYKIVAITMDITLLRIDGKVKKNDEVFVIRNPRHLDEIASHNQSVAEEAICLLNERIQRVNSQL